MLLAESGAAVDPAVVADEGGVLLQIRADVPDREAARRAAKDLDWKRALRLEVEGIPFHHTTLSVFIPG